MKMYGKSNPKYARNQIFAGLMYRETKQIYRAAAKIKPRYSAINLNILRTKDFKIIQFVLYQKFLQR
jgi:hypothetical protein